MFIGWVAIAIAGLLVGRRCGLWAMLAMLGLLVLVLSAQLSGCSTGHGTCLVRTLVVGAPSRGSWVLRVRGVEHGPIVRCGGGGGGGERRALHDPIGLTIVIKTNERLQPQVWLFFLQMPP